MSVMMAFPGRVFDTHLFGWTERRREETLHSVDLDLLMFTTSLKFELTYASTVPN